MENFFTGRSQKEFSGFLVDGRISQWPGLVLSEKKCWKNLHSFLPPLPEEKEDKFEQELTQLLALKRQGMLDLEVPDNEFDELTIRMGRLFLTSLASNRTPDEIIEGLQEDAEMREEVIELLLSETNVPVSYQAQRAFLLKLLSGDEDFKSLLNKQTSKKGFPYNL